MFTLRVALRYLFSKKTHAAVNVISMISIVGVAVATMAIICVLSVFNGFSELAMSKISSIAPDLRVEPVTGKTLSATDSITSIINSSDGVVAAAPVIEEKALAIYENRQLPVFLKGVTSDFELITSIDSLVKEDGQFLLSDSTFGDMTVISVGVAISTGARPGSYIPMELYVPRREGRINPANPAASFRSDTLLVSGVFQSEQAEYDTDLMVVPIDVMRRLLNYDTEASAIEIRTAPGTIPSVKKNLSSLLGDSYKVLDRMEQQEDSFKMITVEKWITFFMLAFILIIASFNVISTLSMLIIEKDSNIRTLYALGASKGMIRHIFILEGWLISAAGGIAGVIIGVALCIAQQSWGIIKLGGNHEAMTTDIYPVKVEFPDIISVLLLVAAIGLFTSLLTSLFMRKRLSQQLNNTSNS